MIQIYPLRGLGEVVLGSDLGALIIDGILREEITPQHGDIVVVTQKIVSKSEGRLVALAGVEPGPEALRLAEITGKDPRVVEVVLSESSEVVRATPHVLITRHRSGLVMANAGVDRSNIGPKQTESVLLLPLDADLSAERLRKRLADQWPAPPAVVISDSAGRPWRQGVVHLAIGASGLPALWDRRGETDRDGRRLEVTQAALGDMVATAAGLVMGEGAESVPTALVRGCVWAGPSRPASALVRPLHEDLFR